MQPCAAQGCWSARISSWKVIAKRGAPYTSRTTRIDPSWPSIDAHAAEKVDALQPPSELGLDEPGEQSPGLGAEGGCERLARPRLDRRQSREHRRIDARSSGPRAAVGAGVEARHEAGEGQGLELEGQHRGGSRLAGIEAAEPVHCQREELGGRLVLAEQLAAQLERVARPRDAGQLLPDAGEGVHHLHRVEANGGPTALHQPGTENRPGLERTGETAAALAGAGGEGGELAPGPGEERH